MVSDVISFSLNDGPGIRTTVFMKGCPLRCLWCHNPETHRMQPQVLYAASKCVHCGACAAACQAGIRRVDGSWITDCNACVGCGACVNACPVQANRLVGQEMAPEALCERLLRDKPFFRERGGVTFSGGEPLMQAAFVAACASQLKEQGVHCAVETSLYAPWSSVEPLLDSVSLWLCDWKVTDPQRHQTLTGVSQTLIRDNLRRLDAHGASVVLRCPIIPGCNDDEAHFAGIAALTHELPHIASVDILPYHAIGNDKRLKLGMAVDGIAVPQADTKQAWLERLTALCRVPVHLSGG